MFSEQLLTFLATVAYRNEDIVLNFSSVTKVSVNCLQVWLYINSNKRMRAGVLCQYVAETPNSWVVGVWEHEEMIIQRMKPLPEIPNIFHILNLCLSCVIVSGDLQFNHQNSHQRLL